MQLSFLNAYAWLKNPYKLMDIFQKKYGESFELKLPFLGKQLVTSDPALIKEIIADKTLVAGKAVHFLRPILGNHSIIMQDGVLHNARHHSLSAYFFSDRIKKYDEVLTTILLQETSKLMVNQTISIQKLTQSVLLPCIIKIIFGDKDSQGLDDLRVSIEAMYRDCASLSLIAIKLSQLPLVRDSRWGKFTKHMNQIKTIIRQLIHQQDYIHDQSSLMYHIAIAQLCPYKHEELIDEILALILFGHDTASATLAWCFFHVYQNKDALQAILQEVANHTPDLDKRIIYPAIYACISESMRLKPVVVHLSRMATKSRYLGTFRIAKNQRVLPSSYLAHHNDQVFENPHQYCPSRFLDGKEYSYSYFPFGIGNRICIGKILALRQMQLIMAHILKRFKLTLVTPIESSPTRHLVIMAPADGALFKIDEIL